MDCYCCSDCSMLPGFVCCGFVTMYFTLMYNQDGTTNSYHPCGCTCDTRYKKIELSLIPCITIMK